MNSAARLITFFCIAGLFVWFFCDALFHGGMFCFRDAAHYYYPLFQCIAKQWGTGQMPLWNPYENLGQPLAGNPTASVFYPGKLIFALPIAYPWAYKLYISGHVLLAAFAAYRLARHWKASIAAAGMCALSYAFCGNVLFQYCNVVFLVGAAWLPLALLAADRMLVSPKDEREQTKEAKRKNTGRSIRWAVAFGVVLAMMVLGGDPQMAYNAGLLATLYAWLLWLENKRRCQGQPAKRDTDAVAPIGDNKKAATCFSYLGLLALAAVVGLVLSAVQVLPSLEFVRRCNRSSYDTATNAGRLLARPASGTHGEHAYHFSVGPWRLAEYVWPNVSGRQFPIHRRWLEAVPAEGRIWTPSLYMGVLPFVLALSALRLRRGKPHDSLPDGQRHIRWLSWTVLLAVLASFGWYGLGWLLQEMHLDTGVGAPFGGLYWLMTVLLPGYASFRYPAKLLVVAALGLSVLAARGWDHALTESADRVRRWLLGLGLLSLVAGAVALAIRPFFAGWLNGVRPDVLLGPLDTAGAFRDLLGAFVQTAVLCGAFWWLLMGRHPRFGKRGATTDLPSRVGSTMGQANGVATKKAAAPFFSRWVPMVALILVALDLGVANRWMIVCAPAQLWQGESKMATAIARSTGNQSSDSLRVFRHPIWMRPEWKTTGSPTRLAEAVRWDRNTLWPKYNLAARISMIEVHGSMMLTEYERWLRDGHRYEQAEYVILPTAKSLPDGRQIDVDVPDASLWHNVKHRSRAWIQQTGKPCRVLHDEPHRVEIEATLDEPGLVVLADQFYPGWQLEVQTTGRAGQGRAGRGRAGRGEEPWTPRPLVRCNHVMRGVRLDTGTHHLIYRYRPTSFFCGATVSGLGWLALIVGCPLTLLWSLRRQ